jgi:hypothetical protein
MPSPLDAAQRIGTLPWRDASSTVHACLAGVLRLHGVHISIDRILGSIPVPPGGAGPREMRAVARRVGIQVRELHDFTPPRLAPGALALACNAARYWFLLWSLDGATFLAGLPGVAESYRQVEADSPLLAGLMAGFVLHYAGPGPALRQPYRPPRLWLLPWRPAYQGPYDEAAVRATGQPSVERLQAECPPPPLAGLGIADLLACHRAIDPHRPALFGTFRRLNLRRAGTLFVDHPQVPALTAALLRQAAEHQARGVDDALGFAARLCADFLSIHPFQNANYRIVQRLLSCYLARWRLGLHWHLVDATDHYFWMRCAQHGHLAVLRHGLERRLYALAA